MQVKCDVLVRFDESSGKIVLQTVPSSRLDAFFRQPHAAWVCRLDELQALTHDEAEALVGRKVLRELDRHGPSRLNLRDFEALEREEVESALDRLEQRAAAGEPSAQLAAFSALWNQALRSHSLELLERAEACLSAASAQNHAPALAMAAAWPRLRAEALATIASGKP